MAVRSNARRLAPLALVTSLLAGCSAEVNVGTADRAPGERIAERLGEEYAARTGVELTRLACEDVEREARARFACSGTNDRGVQLDLTGEVTRIDDEGFDYRWRVAEALAPGVYYERALRRLIERRGVAIAEIRCPSQIPLAVGARTSCEATDRRGITKRVTIRLTDRDGGFEFGIGDGPDARS